MRPRIAIPQAHSTNEEFTGKTMPRYAHAVEVGGGEPVEIPANLSNAEIMHIAMTCDGVLLPGSPADVNPEKYGEEKHPKTAAADAVRDNADELLLQDAYNMHKPVLGICFGVQSLNVWRTGSLVQHLETGVRHTKDKDEEQVADPVHPVRIAPESKLAGIVAAAGTRITTNSSHHQAVATAGDGLRVVAWSDQDEVIEAVEGTADDHFVLGVQWHPERTVDNDEPSRAIFRAFVHAAEKWHAHPRTQSPDFETVDER
jgi:putative glutamine amidotransferase